MRNFVKQPCPLKPYNQLTLSGQIFKSGRLFSERKLAKPSINTTQRRMLIVDYLRFTHII